MTDNSDKKTWEHFSHDADIGIRGSAQSLEETFEMAAIALTAVVTNPTAITPAVEVHIQCKEEDIELLFYDWINALIYEMDTRKMLFADFKVHIKDGLLNAMVRGEQVNTKGFDLAVDIKGATMTELKVIEGPTGWLAQCVVDV